MRVKLLTLRYAPALGGFDDRPLSDFVRDKEVLAVREHFFTVHDLPHLACLVTYQDPVLRPDDDARRNGRERRPTRGRATGKDILEGLPAKEQALFGTLREWRAARARKDGVPPFVVFTNRELLAIIQAKPKTPTALQSLEGVGAGKVERYGKAVLRIVGGQGESDSPPEAPA